MAKHNDFRTYRKIACASQLESNQYIGQAFDREIYKSVSVYIQGELVARGCGKCGQIKAVADLRTYWDRKYGRRRTPGLCRQCNTAKSVEASRRSGYQAFKRWSIRHPYYFIQYAERNPEKQSTWLGWHRERVLKSLDEVRHNMRSRHETVADECSLDPLSILIDREERGLLW